VLKKKFEHKLNQQMESHKLTQADKTMQDTHSHKLKDLIKNMHYLIKQVSLIADTLQILMPLNGVGKI